MDEELQIVEVGSNLFQFKFKSGFELDRVLKGGPWTFDNQALMLRWWQLGMTAANVKFDSIALWIQIWNAPFDMISPIVVAEIGNRLGEVVEVEKRRTQDTEFLYEGEGRAPNVKADKTRGIHWWIKGFTFVGVFQVREATHVLPFLWSVGS